LKLRFGINLQNGPGREPLNIPYHISVDLTDPKKPFVECARRSRGQWDKIDKLANTFPFGFPFKKGKPFEICIICNADEFVVEADYKLLCTFKLKNHYEEVDHIGVIGDIAEIEAVRIF
jgi:hypothetical protein